MSALPTVMFNDKTLTIKANKTFTFSHYRTIYAITKSNNNEFERIEVDFQNTLYIDSAGLGMLLILRDFCRKNRLELDIINSTKGNTASMLEVIGLTSGFLMGHSANTPLNCALSA
ncbi:hypothetical protein [Thalassotalea sediminis]|uniref:hypothetical protein n=1 Tax=Thalassotalea sediminis TaxID=1759089 RepID=UPI002573CBF9|nr:hypothetical protein [Thalassotalea sediminis]